MTHLTNTTYTAALEVNALTAVALRKHLKRKKKPSKRGIGGLDKWIETKYCPNCGADMREEIKMDRLTYDNTINGVECIELVKVRPAQRCDKVCESAGNCNDCPINEALCKLYEYEKFGLTPDEISKKLFALSCMDEAWKDIEKGLDELMEYRKAKDEGRLLVLNCKVGDKLRMMYEGAIEKTTPEQV